MFLLLSAFNPHRRAPRCLTRSENNLSSAAVHFPAGGMTALLLLFGAHKLRADRWTLLAGADD